MNRADDRAQAKAVADWTVGHVTRGGTAHLTAGNINVSV